MPTDWRLWIEESAKTCHLSAFRMLKAALPAGWLGQARKPLAGSGRSLWWVGLAMASPPEQGLPERQQALVSWLKQQHPDGVWQRDLIQAGFSADLLRRLETRGLIARERRRALEPAPATLAAPLEPPQALTSEQREAVDAFETIRPGPCSDLPRTPAGRPRGPLHRCGVRSLHARRVLPQCLPLGEPIHTRRDCPPGC